MKLSSLRTYGKETAKEVNTRAWNTTTEAMYLLTIIAYCVTLTLSTLYVIKYYSPIWLIILLVMAWRGMLPKIWYEMKEFYTVFMNNYEKEKEFGKK